MSDKPVVMSWFTTVSETGDKEVPLAEVVVDALKPKDEQLYQHGTENFVHQVDLTDHASIADWAEMKECVSRWTMNDDDEGGPIHCVEFIWWRVFARYGEGE